MSWIGGERGLEAARDGSTVVFFFWGEGGKGCLRPPSLDRQWEGSRDRPNFQDASTKLPRRFQVASKTLT